MTNVTNEELKKYINSSKKSRVSWNTLDVNRERALKGLNDVNIYIDIH